MIDNFIDKKTEKYLLDKLKDLDNTNFHDGMEIGIIKSFNITGECFNYANILF